MASDENLPPNVIKQLAKELKVLHETPREGIKVVVNDDDFSTIYADIEGPAGTPYENGIFRMKLLLSREFPQSPPKGYFLTKIFHPNIATNGEICVNTLKKDWNPGLGLCHVLLVVRCLLIEPFPESALNEQAGKMLLEDYDEYARRARLYTGIHALKPKSKSKSGPISESTTALNVPPTLLGASIDSKRSLVNNHDHQSTTALASASSELAVSASAAGIVVLKKVAASASGAAKFMVDEKKMDARKKSLKRL